MGRGGGAWIKGTFSKNIIARLFREQEDINLKIEMSRFGKPFNPNEKKNDKRKSHARVIIFLIVAIVVVTAATICIESVIKGYVTAGQEATWTASIASYWGGIIGGMVSGVLAFLGVFYTIRYYKESDAQKERAAVQPFLMIETHVDPRHEASNGFFIGEKTEDNEKLRRIDVRIKNIGHGFAKTLVVHTNQTPIGGHAFNRVINVGESAYTFFMLNEEDTSEILAFALQYIDSMTNEYIQNYELRLEHGRLEIECGYPQVLE